MAQYAIRATATIPAGTPADAPIILAVTLDNWDIESIDLEVPAGPNGLMGFYLANNGVPWIPNIAGEYIVWNDHAQSFAAQGYPTGSGWQVIGYNTGGYDHNVIVTFHVNTPDVGVAPVEPPVVLTFVQTASPSITTVLP